MDVLIDLLIRLLTGLFGDAPPGGRGPGFPNLPPRPTPTRPPGQTPIPTAARQQEMRRRTAGQPQRPPAQKSKPARAPAAAPPQPVARQARVAAPPAPAAAQAAKRPSVAVDAAALRRWLRPQVLHNQFILSEIFQPPLALRRSER